MEFPKISIITVCKNEVTTIGKTIKSVLAQSYGNKEYIVVEGGSTDGTRNRIERYLDGIDVYQQQKGAGIYNAMNQGIRQATGDYIYFLNAGDTLFSSETLANVAGEIRNNSNPDIVYGDLIMVGDPTEKLVRSYPEINLENLKNGMVCHQVIFSKKELFDNDGLFDESLSIVADYDWLVRKVVSGQLRSAYVDHAIVRFDNSGVSSTTDYRYQMFLAMKRYYGLFPSIERIYLPNISRKFRNAWKKLL